MCALLCANVVPCKKKLAMIFIHFQWPYYVGLCIHKSEPYLTGADESSSLTADALLWRQHQRFLRSQRKKAAQKFKSPFGEELFNGLARKPVKALSYPYLCESTGLIPSQAGEQPSNQIKTTPEHLDDAWTNFWNAKETQLLLWERTSVVWYLLTIMK